MTESKKWTTTTKTKTKTNHHGNDREQHHQVHSSSNTRIFSSAHKLPLVSLIESVFLLFTLLSTLFFSPSSLPFRVSSHLLSTLVYLYAFAQARFRTRYSLILPLLLILPRIFLHRRTSSSSTDFIPTSSVALPSLFICTLISPAISATLPNSKGRPHVAFIAAIIAAAAGIVHAAWNVARPHAEKIRATDPRELVLVDLFFTTPAIVQIPAYIAGLIAGRVGNLQSAHYPARSSSLLTKAAAAAAAYIALALALAPRISHHHRNVSLFGYYSVPASLSLRAHAIANCALLIPLCALVLSIDALSCTVASVSLRSTVVPLPHILYLAAAVAEPVQNAVSALFCTTTRKKHFAGADVKQCKEAKWLFLPILLTAAIVVYACAQRPLDALLKRATQHIPHWPASEPPVDVPDEYESNGMPKRSLKFPERFMRVLAYYTIMILFFTMFFRIGAPASFVLARRERNPVLCLLPRSFYACTESATGKLGWIETMNSSWGFRTLLTACRVLSLLALPSMVLNVLGHVVFPRVNWNSMPSVHDMLENAAVRNAAADTSIAKAGCRNRILQFEEKEPASVVDVEALSPPEQSSDEEELMRDLPKWDSRIRAFSRRISSGDDAMQLDLDFVLYVRYVTRGTSASARMVARNAKRAAHVLRQSGLPEYMWRVEIVTDNFINVGKEIAHSNVYEIVVPREYSPPGGALFKARALNYAIEKSPARDFDWIMHLDEETLFDTDTVTAVLNHCGKELYKVRVRKTERYPRIGQGPIVYGRKLLKDMWRDDRVRLLSQRTEENAGMDDEAGTFENYVEALHHPQSVNGEVVAEESVQGGNWVTTLADSGRVSDDCGRYRMQFECGEVWVGMHGSFVVAANAIEKQITFDHGIEGSIAEDAYFALKARAAGVRFSWIDALMFEQSPFNFTDFVKQRARWLVGGIQVVLSNNIPWRVRPVMAVLSTLWALMPITYVCLIISVVLGSLEDKAYGSQVHAHWFYATLLPISAAVSMWGYFFGFVVTFARQGLGIVRFCALLYLQMLLAPVFGFMEVSSVCYALFHYRKLSMNFHVVDKDAAAGASGGLRGTSEHAPLISSAA